VFSVVDSVLLKPLAYPGADQLVAVSHSAPGAPGRSGDLSLSPSMFFTYADAASVDPLEALNRSKGSFVFT
jgi:hypothetical protein